MVRTAALGFAALLAASPVLPAEPNRQVYLTISGAKFMELCGNDWHADMLLSPCASYLDGVIDGLGLGGAYCPPMQTSTPQLQTIIYNYVKSRPEEWHMPAGFAAQAALRKAFPCAVKK